MRCIYFRGAVPRSKPLITLFIVHFICLACAMCIDEAWASFTPTGGGADIRLLLIIGRVIGDIHYKACICEVYFNAYPVRKVANLPLLQFGIMQCCYFIKGRVRFSYYRYHKIFVLSHHQKIYKHLSSLASSMFNGTYLVYRKWERSTSEKQIEQNMAKRHSKEPWWSLKTASDWRPQQGGTGFREGHSVGTGIIKSVHRDKCFWATSSQT